MDFQLSEEEQLVLDTVRDLAETKFKGRAIRIDEEKVFPSENIRELAELGLLGSIIDDRYGGAGASVVTYAVLLQELARACASTSVIVSVTTMVAKAIEREGTEEQKQRFLPKLASGETLGAFCLTEAEAGSDPSAMRTTATLDGEDYVLNGQKLWITNATEAGIFLIMAKEDPSLGRKGISAFIVDKSAIGPDELEIGLPEKKMGLHGSHTCAIFIKNLKIPKENRLGSLGRGLNIALQSLDTGRIGIAAQATGIAQAAFEAALVYAKEREQFGQQIGKFQAISFKLADMKMKLDAARLLTLRAAWLGDQGQKHTQESSIAKAYATEAAFDITAQAIRVHGGMGFSQEFPVERYHRDVQATLIYEGTNEIQRIVIARSLGL